MWFRAWFIHLSVDSYQIRFIQLIDSCLCLYRAACLPVQLFGRSFAADHGSTPVVWLCQSLYLHVRSGTFVSDRPLSGHHLSVNIFQFFQSAHLHQRATTRHQRRLSHHHCPILTLYSILDLVRVVLGLVARKTFSKNVFFQFKLTLTLAWCLRKLSDTSNSFFARNFRRNDFRSWLAVISQAMPIMMSTMNSMSSPRWVECTLEFNKATTKKTNNHNKLPNSIRSGLRKLACLSVASMNTAPGIQISKRHIGGRKRGQSDNKKGVFVAKMELWEILRI